MEWTWVSEWKLLLLPIFQAHHSCHQQNPGLLGGLGRKAGGGGPSTSGAISAVTSSGPSAQSQAQPSRLCLLNTYLTRHLKHYWFTKERWDSDKEGVQLATVSPLHPNSKEWFPFQMNNPQPQEAGEVLMEVLQESASARPPVAAITGLNPPF